MSKELAAQVMSGGVAPEMIAQVGGTHYGTAAYQHWDLVLDADLGYAVGNCTKYLARAHKKGRPVEDLEKALSYYDKWASRGAGRERSSVSDGGTITQALDLYFLSNPTPASAVVAIRAVVCEQRWADINSRGLIDACLQDAIADQRGSER